MESLTKFLLRPRMHKPETVLDGNIRTGGFTMDDHIEAPDGFDKVEEWCEYTYRVVWKNDHEMATLTYCEGDITVVQCPTRIIYEKELANAKEFYEGVMIKMTEKEWFDSVEDSVIVEAPPDRWGGSDLVYRNDNVFALRVDELLMMLETTGEFYETPTKENMIKIAKEYVETQIEVMRLDATAYIEEALPLFLKEELKD